MNSLAFNCQRCGHCCQGEGGIILTDHDQMRLAKHLGMDIPSMLEKYAQTRNGKIELICGDDGYCIFYKDGCGIHPGRPDVCRAWPFFRGNLVDETSWALSLDYCPGINKDAGFAEFVRQGRKYLKDNDLLKDDMDDAPNALKNND